MIDNKKNYPLTTPHESLPQSLALGIGAMAEKRKLV